MFEGWDSFFLLLGGAGGGLIGLLFVVVTLVRGNDAQLKLRASSIYMAPIVFHLAAVLTLSAIADAPLSPAVQGGAVGAATLVGLWFSIRAVLMLGPRREFKAPHWSDIWCYGVLPLVAYVPLGATAAAVCAGLRWAPLTMAGALVALLLIAIRNAWDLVTWISARGDELNTESEPRG